MDSFRFAANLTKFNVEKETRHITKASAERGGNYNHFECCKCNRKFSALIFISNGLILETTLYRVVILMLGRRQHYFYCLLNTFMASALAHCYWKISSLIWSIEFLHSQWYHWVVIPPHTSHWMQPIGKSMYNCLKSFVS